MNKISWKARVGIVLSGLWLVLVYMFASESESWRSLSVIFGVAPVAFIWGCVWVLKGFFAQRKRTDNLNVISSVDKKEKRATLYRRLGGIALALIGLVLAYSYGEKLGNGAEKAGETLGYYLLFCLIGVAIWSKSGLKKNQKGYIALIIGAVYLFGGSYDAYKMNAEHKEITQMLQLLTNYTIKLSSGDLVTAAEIKKANLGKYEPFVLSLQEFHAKELSGLHEYSQLVDDAEIPSIINASITSTPDGINNARKHINMLILGIGKIESEINSLSIRFVATEKSISMPESFRVGLMSKLENNMESSRKTFAEFWEIERDLMVVLQKRIDLLENEKGQYVISSKNKILFKNQNDLDEYNNQYLQFQNLAQKEATWTQEVNSKTDETISRLANGINGLKK